MGTSFSFINCSQPRKNHNVGHKMVMKKKDEKKEKIIYTTVMFNNFCEKLIMPKSKDRWSQKNTYHKKIKEINLSGDGLLFFLSGNEC